MPIKIMYLLDYYHGPSGGTERHVLQLIQHLDRSCYEPSMTLLRKSDYVESNGFACRVMVLGISKLASIRSIVKLLRFGFSLRRQGYQIVHCFFNDVSLMAPPLLRIFGVRVLVSRRDMGFWYTPWILKALRLTSRFVDHYVVNSQAVKRIVQEREHVAEEKIAVIYNGCLPEEKLICETAKVTKQLGSENSGRIIGIVANLRPIKRVDTIIEAFGAIHTAFPDVRLAIVGDCQSKQAKSVFERLVDLANLLGVREKVIFTGSVDEPSPYISRFSVAVLCSESEGFSNSLIEYMQARRPIVCTDSGGNPELVQDGKNGFLVPVGDVNALAERLVVLLADSALARRLGDAARETVRSMCSHTRMVTEQMACYDQVLSGTRSDRQFNGASRILQ